MKIYNVSPQSGIAVPERGGELGRWAKRSEWVSGILIVLVLCLVGWAFVGPLP